jgi:hypothetical protein
MNFLFGARLILVAVIMLNPFIAPPVVLEPPITWSEDVPRRRDRPTWEANQSQNPTASGAHFIRRIYCEPTKPDGSRVIKYMLDGSDVSVNLPRPAYRCSLDDLLPLEVERAPWMNLTRHPLIWDGQVRPRRRDFSCSPCGWEGD